MNTNIVNDHEDVHIKLFKLDELNDGILKIISHLESQLKRDIEKDEVHVSQSDKVNKSDSNINSIFELEDPHKTSMNCRIQLVGFFHNYVVVKGIIKKY